MEFTFVISEQACALHLFTRAMCCWLSGMDNLKLLGIAANYL